MVDAFSPAFTLAPLAPLAVAPAAASQGALVPSTPVGSDWSAKKRETDAQVRTERRSAIERARSSVEAGWSRPGHLTKAERLAQANSTGKRDTGGLAERRSTLSSVQKAMAKFEGVATDKDIGLSRETRDAIRSRYADVGEFVKVSEAWDARLKDNPVEAREALIAAYTKMAPQNWPDHKAAEPDTSVRGSIRRAQQDATDARSLQAAEAKYGSNLPKILEQLQKFDRAMIDDPSVTSARLAMSHGAPSVEAEVAPYMAKQAAKDRAKAIQKRYDEIHLGICLAVQRGLIPGDAASLWEIAAVMALPHFQHNPANPFEALRRATHIAMHPDHVWLSGKKRTARSGPRPGDKSIGGGPSTYHDSTRPSLRPATGVRAAIDRATARQ
jgi:hypothetical protein